MTEDLTLAEKYSRITQDNIRRRGEEFDDIGQHLAEELYSDRTHFIYELLQNAEDALARRKLDEPVSRFPTNVDFHLFHDRLELRHYGQPFDDQDIRSISDVFKSTKTEDLSMIGKKGIGFKSVYAFTQLPEVYSKSERFRIERFIRLKVAAPRKLQSGETLFVLPFFGTEEAKLNAFDQISRRLAAIDLRPLLFLRHVTEINWTVEGEANGHYQHECKDEGWARRVTLISENPGREVRETWLVFQQGVRKIPSQSPLMVEIAFRLGAGEPGQTQDVVPVKDSRLLVYFPTKLETHVGFVMQGPYRTTANREDIHHPDDWNSQLITSTAELVVGALRKFRDQKKLTPAVLSAMPIDPSAFQPDTIFRPIYDQVRKALREEPLLPTNDGGYVAGNTAKVARGEDLLELLTPQQLCLLLMPPSKSQRCALNWINRSITEDLTPVLYRYLVGRRSVWDLENAIEPLVENIEVRPETILRQLSKQFFEQQPDEWFIKLYQFMLGQRSSWQEVLDKPFVRLQPAPSDAKPVHVCLFRTEGQTQVPNAYLPGKVESDLPLVKRTIAVDEKAREFLRELGLTEPNLVAEVLQKIIPKYTGPKINVTTEEHRRDMEKIVAALQTDSQTERAQLLSRLRDVHFLIASNLTTDKKYYVKAGDLYIRSPELLLYFEGNKDIFFLDDPNAIPQEIEEMLGIAREVRVTRAEPDYYGHVKLVKQYSWHKRGINRFDPGLSIEGLKHALSHQPTVEKSMFVWNKLLVPNSHCLHGIVESCSRQTFEGASKEEIFSKVGQLAKQHSWLPTKNAAFAQPNQLSIDELPVAFQRDEAVSRALGMKFSSLETLAREAGVQPHIVEYFSSHPDAATEFEEFQRWREGRKPKPKRPEAESGNTERREQRVAEQTRSTQPTRRESRQRQVRVNWTNKGEARTNLTELNTNEDGQMICQICGDEMPFKLDNGKYFFEATECVKGLGRELPQNYIALCPVCAAKYQHANGTPPEDVKQRILNANGAEIPVTLAQAEAGIIFTKVHLQDLQTALRNLDAS
jgi:hypothetical protein